MLNIQTVVVGKPTQYEYGLDNLPEKTTLNNGKEVTYTYDTLGRLTGKVLNTATPLNFAYTYEASDRGSGYTTTKVETEQMGDTTYKYTYDDYGNITKIQKVNADNSVTTLYTYVYDDYNQLTTVNDYEHSEQTTYTYNQAGNITRRNRYQMNASWVITATLENVRYVYGDSEWKDLLTTYNGQTITYDAIGNPLSYRDGISLTWQKGRKLASYSDASNNITYTYDASGMRTGKSVVASSGTTTNYSYVYENGLLQKMTRGNRILEFSYDANGTPVSIKYRSSAAATPVYYYYGVNSRGDVTSLYNSDGSVAAIYSYDAYGKLLSVKTSAGIDITGSTSIAILNPLRYRSYVYDNETGLYYVSSRYYDPEIGRWINADSVIAGVGGSIQGYNMFAYCFNNPVNMSDSSGHWPQWMKDAANWVNNNIIQPVANFFSPSTNTISGQFQEGILRGSGSLTGGYSEINGRLQVNSKDSKNNGMLGGFAKVSTGNASGKIGVGNDNVALSLKGVGDGLTATAQAGIQYKNGAGLAAKAKAAVLSGRATAELELFGWQIEFGVSGDLLSAGAEAMIGVFPDEGFTAKANVGAGLFGAGFVFRVKPAQ